MNRFERFTISEISLHWGNALSVFFLTISGFLIWQGLDEWQFRGYSIVSFVHAWVFGALFAVVPLIYVLRPRGSRLRSKGRFKLAQRLSIFAVCLLALVSIITGLLLLLRLYFEMPLPAKDFVRSLHQVGLIGFSVFFFIHMVMIFVVPGHTSLITGMISGFIDRDTAFRTNRAWAMDVERGSDEDSI